MLALDLAPPVLPAVTDLEWAMGAEPGSYLALFDDDDLDDVSDPGSRCGRDDMQLDAIRGVLDARGLQLVADDIGLVAVKAEGAAVIRATKIAALVAEIGKSALRVVTRGTGISAGPTATPPPRCSATSRRAWSTSAARRAAIACCSPPTRALTPGP